MRTARPNAAIAILFMSGPIFSCCPESSCRGTDLKSRAARAAQFATIL
jgi:hypothetical protein